jgi:hypothetical protein
MVPKMIRDKDRSRQPGRADDVCSSRPSSWGIALDEKSAADFLWHECGYVIAQATLRKRRCVGGGPPFFKAGRRVFYEPEPLRHWGLAQRSPNVNSTSELDELLRKGRPRSDEAEAI